MLIVTHFTLPSVYSGIFHPEWEDNREKGSDAAQGWVLPNSWYDELTRKSPRRAEASVWLARTTMHMIAINLSISQYIFWLTVELET